MNLLLAQKLLKRTSQIYMARNSSLSRQEIVSKINEIKHLAEKKKTPKLSIQKKIRSLEHQLEGVYDLQQNIASERKQHSQKEARLKGRIVQLEHQLELGKDKAIHKKVERLSSILSDHVLKQKVKRDVSHLRSANRQLKLSQGSKYHKKSSYNITRADASSADKSITSADTFSHSDAYLALSQSRATLGHRGGSNNKTRQTRLERAQLQINRLKDQLVMKKDTLDNISRQILIEKIHLLEIKLGIHLADSLHHSNATAQPMPVSATLPGGNAPSGSASSALPISQHSATTAGVSSYPPPGALSQSTSSSSGFSSPPQPRFSSSPPQLRHTLLLTPTTPHTSELPLDIASRVHAQAGTSTSRVGASYRPTPNIPPPAKRRI